LVPDANAVLVPAKDLVYNDAPWLARSTPELAETKHFVHPSVQNDLADRLGAKSLRYLSFVDKEMTKDLPCLSSDAISNIIANYGEGESVLFDVLEIADKFKAHMVHVIYDKRTHPQISILQPNLGECRFS
jgi:sacsin